MSLLFATWKVLGFEYVGGRHPDYCLGSADTSLEDPGTRREPCLNRLAAAELFTVEALLRTDYNPENILMTPGSTAQSIDRAWRPAVAGGSIPVACSSA